MTDDSIPKRGIVSVIREKVQPYRVLSATMWSPELSTESSVAEMAPMPDEKATQSSPPSSNAIFFSSTPVVGLPRRE